MFKSAATKIAHNSTLPALALSGNKDLRPLQDLITAEKVVLVSLQKLSVDFTKASEALRVWGGGEGDDLGDILGASTTVLAHFSAALSAYATKEHAIRDHLKAIRTREEALDELKRRRKATLARADSAEKKLNKMGPEHKNLAQQTDTLNQLQAQIRQMDNDIMVEEAAIGDFKRTSAREFMSLKFGGLMECCEKGCVVAEIGRSIVSEISEEPTPPGLSRTMYMGRQRTEQRVADAERCVNEIVFSALPPSAPSNAPPRLNTNFGDGDTGSMDMNNMNTPGGLSMQNTGVSSISMQNTGMTGGGMEAQSPYESGPGSSFLPPPPGGGSGFLPPPAGSYLPPPRQSSFLPPPDVGAGLMEGGASPGGSYPVSSQYVVTGSPGGPFSSSQGGYTPNSSAGGTYPAPVPAYAPSAPGGTSPGGTTQGGVDTEARDDVGVGLSSMGVGLGGGPEGPAGGRFATFPVRGRGYSLRDDGPAGAGQSESGSGFRPGPDAPSLGATRRQDTSGSDFMAAVLDAGEFGTRARERDQPPLPQQQSFQGQSGSQFSQQGQGSQFSSKQQEREQEMERQRQQEEEPAPEYRDYEPTSHSQVFEYPGAMPPGPPPGAAAPVVGSVWAGDSAPGSMMRNPSNLTVEEGGGDRQSTVSEDIGLAYMNMNDDEAPLEGEGERERQARLSKHVRFGKETEFVEPPEPPFMKRQESSSSLSTASRSRRVPPPTFDPTEEERALNAAAAREVSRELDALNFSPPPPAQPPQVQVQSEPGWEYASSPTREQPPSPPTSRDTSSSPQRQYQPPASPPQNQYQPPASPPQNQYAPPPPPPSNQYAPPPSNREPSPRIPPASFSRKATVDNSLPPGATHQRGPSWTSDAQPTQPAQPAPFAPTHHNTPSWALTPAPPVDGSGSPSSSSPRLDSPYRAPFANRSTSSLNSQVPPGARTISAAAFRRPQKTASGDVADTSPLALKKRLPASPYPQQRAGSNLNPSPQPQQQPPPPPHEDDTFDYISAYNRDSQAFFDDGSPMQADFDYGRLGKIEVVGGTPKSPGYSEGRFATHLDDPDGVR